MPALFSPRVTLKGFCCQVLVLLLSSLTLLSLMGLAQAATTSTVKLTSSSSNPKAGASITLTATVTGSSPTGTVTFKDGSTPLATLTLVPSGTNTATASYTTSSLTLGGHTLTADYAGDSATTASSATPLILTISPPIQTTGQYLYEYNALGQLTRTTTPLGVPTEQDWDRLGRIATQKLPNAAGTATQDSIGYTYDGQGQVESVTDPRGKKTNYTTDGLGNTRALTSPDTGSTDLQYDAAGNLIQKTDARGKVSTLSYDALNRLKTLNAGDESFSYTYDEGMYGAGQLTTLSNPGSTVQWTYNAQGQLASRTQQISSVSPGSPTINLVTAYSYDAYGRLDTVTYPSGRQLKYGYNSNGQIQSLTLDGQAILSNLTYTPFGPVKGWVWGNAQSYARSYDLNGRMTQFTVGDGTRSVVWDASSRIRQIDEQTLNGTSQAVAAADYDTQDRLTQYQHRRVEPQLVRPFRT